MTDGVHFLSFTFQPMPKKKTAHAANRLAKKLAESDREFFLKRIPTMVHPFGDDSLSKLIRILFGMEFSDIRVLPRNESENWPWFANSREVPRLFNRLWHTLDFEEVLLLNEILEDVSEDTAFDVSYQRQALLRTLDPKRLFENLEKYGEFIWLKPDDIGRHVAAMENSVRSKNIFALPDDCDWSMGSIMYSAMLYWIWKRKQEWARPKGESNFIGFLVDLIRLIVYRPKEIKVYDQGRIGLYSYEFNDVEVVKFEESFKLSRFWMLWKSNEKRHMEPVHWSISIIALQRLLERGGFRSVSLVIMTRPMRDFAESLKNYCETRGMRFSWKHVPYDVVEVNPEGNSVFLIEEKLFYWLGQYSCFPNSTVIPLAGIKESARYY